MCGKKQWEHELWIKFRDDENWVIAEQGQNFIFCQELGILFTKDAEYFLKGATAHKIVDYRHGVYTSEQEYIDKLQETRNFLNTIGATDGEQQ